MKTVTLFKSRITRSLITVAMAVISVSAAAGASEDYQPTTTNEIGVPIDHLRWLVKPLTQDELVAEASAWQGLLRGKVQEITAAEIAVKRQNEQIEKAEDAADALKDAQVAAEDAKAAEDKAATEGVTADTTEKLDEAKKKAAKAQKAIAKAKDAEVKASQDEATKAAETTAVAKAAAKEIEEKVAEGRSAETVTSTNAALTTATATVTTADTNVATQSSEQLGAGADKATAVAEVKAEVKKMVLAGLADLRTQRSHLIERFNVVVDELKAKGGEVEVYEKYRDAATADLVDVKDTSAVWSFVTGWLSSEQGGVKWAVNGGVFIAIFLVFYLAGFVVSKGVTKVTGKSRKMSGLLRNFLVSFIKRLITFIGILVALSFIGVPVGPLLALLSAAGFVIGFALQGTLSNFASGLLILFYRPFDVGDVVEAGGITGTVTAMNLMSTQFKTFDNKLMIVPNNSIFGGTITNATGTAQRRVDMVFGIGYGDSMEKAQAILERIVKSQDKVLQSPAPVIKVHELADSSVNFICRPWVRTSDYWDVYWNITRMVKEEFDKEGVSIPFPQQDVHMYQERAE